MKKIYVISILIMSSFLMYYCTESEGFNYKKASLREEQQKTIRLVTSTDSQMALLESNFLQQMRKVWYLIDSTGVLENTKVPIANPKQFLVSGGPKGKPSEYIFKRSIPSLSDGGIVMEYERKIPGYKRAFVLFRFVNGVIYRSVFYQEASDTVPKAILNTTLPFMQSTPVRHSSMWTPLAQTFGAVGVTYASSLIKSYFVPYSMSVGFDMLVTTPSIMRAHQWMRKKMTYQNDPEKNTSQ